MTLSTSALAATPDGWREVDWQRQARTVKVGRDDVCYVDLGEGDPVLLIHGLGGSWRVWLENLPSLAQRRRVIAVDLPGFGRSAPAGDGIAIHGYSRVLLGVLDELDLERTIVIGNSLGGWIAADLALRAPGRVRALVLVDAGGVVPTAGERRKALAIMDTAARLARHAPRFRSAVASRRHLRSLALRYTFARPRELAADLVYMALPPEPDPGFQPALYAAKRSWSEAWCDRLTEIACPTLIVWGGRDSLLPLRHAREYARRIVGSRLQVIAEAGHLPMLERPDRFNRVVLEFLEEMVENQPVPDAVTGRGECPPRGPWHRRTA
jgi:pimeloyl-ACP methyl ester carboxylesterase